MKVVLAFLFVAVVYAQAIQDDEVLSKWTDFQDTYGKSYRSPVEARKRLSIFRDNLNGIEQHNALYEQGEVSYTKGINQFADWTKEEFLQYVHKGLANKPSIVGSTFNATKGFVAPSSIDWRSKNVVTSVKNQGHCGSCWAFSSTGALEGQLGMNGNLISLSEQNLVDCSLSLGNNGCDGGKMTYSFEYVKENGIMSEADYPYISSEGPCSADASKVVTKVSSYTNIEAGNEDALLEALVTRGPVSVAIDASDMQMYHSGIFDDRTCSSDVLDHAVLLVGYGSENRKKYYILKNSWGPQWGDNGYIKLIKKHNRCGIASMASIPAL